MPTCWPATATASAVLADAIERGQAFLDEGATCVFVPGAYDATTIAQLVDGIGVGKVSVIARRGGATMADLAKLGVARVSCGPWGQQLAMEALADTAATLLAGGCLPAQRRAASAALAATLTGPRAAPTPRRRARDIASYGARTFTSLSK